MAQIKIQAIIEAVDRASGPLRRMGSAFGSARIGAKDFAKSAGMVGGAMTAAGVAMGAFGVQAVKTAGQFQMHQMALETMVGSAEEAQKLFSDLVQFAKVTPFNFEEVIKGTNQLLAMGAAVDDVIPEMEMLGDVSAGLNVPLERIVLNFGQVRAQGKLMGREVKDFAVAGVPLLEILAEQFDTTTAAVREMVTANEIGFEDVKQAFMTMTSEGGRFDDLMKKLSTTTPGRISNLQDAFQQLQKAIGDVFINQTGQAIVKLTQFIEKLEVFVKENPKVVQAIALVTAGLVLFGTLLTGLSVMFLAFSAAITAGLLLPMAAIAAAVTVVIAAGTALVLNWEWVKARAIALWGSIKTTWDNIKTHTITTWTIIEQTITSSSKNAALQTEKAWTNLELITKNTFNSIKGSSIRIWDNIRTSIVVIVNLLKNQISKRLDGIKAKVSSWASAVRGFFNSVANAISNVISRAKELANMAIGGLGSLIPGRQHGGLVGAGRPYIVGEAGPELFVPHEGGRIIPSDRTSGGGSITLSVNIGLYAGSENEKRNVAEELFASLADVASARGVSVQELLG